jgi:formate hydrogenlyase subunit 3/multisubunit Na+/H+ antiporter MnhD subunit
MTEYIEPSSKARQLFFLAVILLGGFALLSSRIDGFLPPLSNDPLVALEQFRQRLIVTTVVLTIFYVALLVSVFRYTRRAVQSGQYPPKGMAVPFRSKVKEIKKPWAAWIFFVLMLCTSIFHIAMPWFGYAKQRTNVADYEKYRAHYEKYRKLIEGGPTQRSSGTPQK